MTKSLTFIPLILMSVCLIAPAFGAASCTSNPLWTKYTDLSPLATPTEITTELKYCKSLKTSSCCTAAVINTFQTRATALQAQIVTIVEKRDKLLVANRDTEIPKIAAKLADLLAKITLAETFLGTAPSTFTDGKDLDKAKILVLTTSLKAIATQATTGLAALKTGLSAFQKARSTCMTELVKLQASTWCLACDPNWNSRGVDDADNTIALDDETCGRLESSCYDYLTGSAAQSNLILAQQLSVGLQNAIDGLEAISKGTVAGIDTFITAVKAIEAGVKSTSDVAAVKVPSTCTSKTECTWLCSSMFKQGAFGAVDNDVAAQGGELNKPIVMPVSGGRILLDGAGRSLAKTGTFKPAVDESGVTISFPQDPAKINQSAGANSASKLVGGFLCLIMTLFGALLF